MLRTALVVAAAGYVGHPGVRPRPATQAAQPVLKLQTSLTNAADVELRGHDVVPLAGSAA